MTGIFAGVFPSSTVFVRNASQLSGTLDSTKVYLIDGVVDMGALQIIVPQSGLSIHGLGFNISYAIY